MMCPSVFFFSLSYVLSTQKSRDSNQQQKRWRCFANNRAWLVENSALKSDKNTTNWSVSGNIQFFKVSSVFNVFYPLQNKLIRTKNYALLLSPKNPTEAGKFLLQKQDKLYKNWDINLLLTKTTTAARSSQEAVMTSHC